MDSSTESLRQATQLTARYSRQAREHDRSHRECPELAREHHLPNDQHVVQGAGSETRRVG